MLKGKMISPRSPRRPSSSHAMMIAVMLAVAATAAPAAVDHVKVATAFGKAIDSGIGWSGLVEKTTASATSPWLGEACMVHALNITTIKAYAEFNKGTKAQFPDAGSTGWVAAWDAGSRNAMVYGMWSATNTKGPSPTGRKGSTRFVYMMHFNAADLIDSFTMVWNDAWFSEQIGWGNSCSCPATRPGASCFTPPPAREHREA